MKILTLILITLLVGLNSSCSWASDKKDTYFFVGCTPGDELIKSQLGISKDEKIDFIRWDLKLNESNTFILVIKFGEIQPNTLGFKSGGQNKTFQGNYTITKNESNEYYRLEAPQCNLSMIKLNDNLLHLLTPQNHLMVGNGGWSYTLNNQNPTKSSSNLPTLTTSSTLNEKIVQVIYDGRTPCQDFATEHQIKVSQECFKLKWKLILNRDSVSHNPTTYTFRKVVDNVPRDVSGTWTIIKGTELNSKSTIYQLDPDKPDETISLFVADENVLFFLHKDKKMFVGNENFSFTLNKRIDVVK